MCKSQEIHLPLVEGWKAQEVFAEAFQRYDRRAGKNSSTGTKHLVSGIGGHQGIDGGFTVDEITSDHGTQLRPYKSSSSSGL